MTFRSKRGKPKYGNRKVTVNGFTFDSKREADRYRELLRLQNAGAITGLQRQVKYELIPSQRIAGKVVERACSYVADFVYVQDGETVVEDTKGFKTPEYVIKRKLMLWIHHIRIIEV